jgi:hypothetical protein
VVWLDARIVAHVSTPELAAFSDALERCITRAAPGRVALDTACVREAVGARPDPARRYVELHCVTAQADPSHLRIAGIVAVAIAIELGDEQPARDVQQRASEIGADPAILEPVFGTSPPGASR